MTDRKTFDPRDAGFSLVDDGRFCRDDDPDCRHPLCDCARYINPDFIKSPETNIIHPGDDRAMLTAAQRKLDASVSPEQAAEYVRKERERNANRNKTGAN